MTVYGHDRVQIAGLDGKVLCELAIFYGDGDVTWWGR